MVNGNDAPVDKPTYMGHIRHFFSDGDIACMVDVGIDLATYEGVKFNALRTYFRVEEGTMPPQPSRRWPSSRVRTFYNWMKNGYPRGLATPDQPVDADVNAHRVRKSITELSPDEVDLLKAAFRGMMARDEDDPESYFAIAGLHWLPGPEYYCRHHENAYNPWHRAYLMRFEDALRSVEGCENVTLPYWDITASEIPSVLLEEPFATYRVRPELCRLDGFCYPANSDTERFPPTRILREIREFEIAENIDEALGQPYWEQFNGWDAGRTQDGIIRAHDNGHNACGTTLRNQDIAAFDPMFWFFHANWDRLWWKWQQSFGATTLNSFKTHVAGSTAWLDNPVLNKLPPFDDTTADTINLSRFGVTYEHPRQEAAARLAALRRGSLRASHEFAVDPAARVSVRVKNVHRLEIPGSFIVQLRAGQSVIGKQAFFQSTEPKHCETCRKNEIASFDFTVDQAELSRGKLQVEIGLCRDNGETAPFPLSACGDPTVNIRLLLEE